MIAPLRGEVHIAMRSGASCRIAPGRLAVVRGPGHYTVADAPEREPGVIVWPGNRCQTVDGRPLAEELSLGVRTWGTGTEESDGILIATYELAPDATRPLLRALPELIVLERAEVDQRLIELLGEEAAREAHGQQVVLDRLLDLLLVQALRTYWARPGTEAPGVVRAYSDPITGPALRLLRNDPARGWTVASLATAIGISRAALARRFAELVGEPPIAYLTRIRLELAADLLRETDESVERIAERVGYGSSYALSTAFKRERGATPTGHRRGEPIAA